MPFTTSADGTRLAYDVWGEGAPLVIITGATCFRRFDPVLKDARAFGHEFAVYSYDRRGRGDSGDAPGWTLEREVDDIEAIIDAAGGSAFLYGHSSGAALALEAALRLGGKVERLVLHDASYVHDEVERVEYAQLADRVGGLLAAGRNAPALRVFLRGIGMPAAFLALLPLVPGWRTMRALAPTLAYDIALTRELAPLARAAEVSVPTQVLVGEKSPVGLHDVAAALAQAIPSARHVVLAGQDHLADRRVVVPTVTAFLKDSA